MKSREATRFFVDAPALKSHKKLEKSGVWPGPSGQLGGIIPSTMSSLPPEESRPDRHGWRAAAAFLGLSLGWFVAVNLLVGAVAAVLVLLDGGDLTAPIITERITRPDVLGIGSAIQGMGLVVCAAGVMKWWRYPLGEGFALRRAGGSALFAATLVGGTIGFFAGWVGLEFAELFPRLDDGHLELLRSVLVDGPLLPRIPMFVAVLVVAPLAEEWVFRGALWTFIEESFGPKVALVVTSLLFAGYHLDPIHVVGILPTAFALGVLRSASRSVWPGVLAHGINNVLGVLVLFVLEEDAELGLFTIALAFAIAMIGLIVCVRGSARQQTS